MNHKTKIFIVSLGLLLIGFFLLLEGVYYSYEYIFEPAYYSVQVSCAEINEDELLSKGYVAGGKFVYGSDNESKNGINIFIPLRYDNSWQDRNRYMESEEYSRTMRHENCHQNQFEDGGGWSCQNKFRVFVDEVECYVKQYL